MRLRSLRIVVAALVLLVVGCTGGGGPTSSPTGSPEVPRGGTLKVARWSDGPGFYDPQRAYEYGSWEVLRCCLVRTLFSFNGHAAEQGGSVVRPDLAAAMPDVSADGLTWTIHLKQGLRYAPPFEDTEIVAADIIRGLLREAGTEKDGFPSSSAGYPFYYSVIEGFDAFRHGEADTISGLETPDPHTLVVRVREPAGDLPFLLAMPAAAPIPEGAANGHEDYGRFLVASGPYMFGGAEDLDFSLPPSRQQPVSGYTPSKVRITENIYPDVLRAGSLVLVRNQSWEPASDPLRHAFVDRIELSVLDPETSSGEALRRIEHGELDLMIRSPLTPRQIDRYRSDPELADRLLSVEENIVYYLPMNVAFPPFDDVHVRRAVNLVVDREEIARGALEDGVVFGVTTHIAPNSLEGRLLADFDPFPQHSGDLVAARDEMRRSRYDRDGDGRCDDRVCRNVPAVDLSARPGAERGFWEASSLIAADLEKIGIDLRVGWADWTLDYYGPLTSGTAALGLCPLGGWSVDYLNGSAFFAPLFAGEQVGGENMSFVGASRTQLRVAGFDRVAVPSVDDRIDRCQALTGTAQTECWADLDRYLMQVIVPWVPLAASRVTIAISARVVQASIDQWTTAMALDQVALASE
jgi:peptide/nickel transport system substrate-binding protein